MEITLMWDELPHAPPDAHKGHPYIWAYHPSPPTPANGSNRQTGEVGVAHPSFIDQDTTDTTDTNEAIPGYCKGIPNQSMVINTALW